MFLGSLLFSNFPFLFFPFCIRHTNQRVRYLRQGGHVFGSVCACVIVLSVNTTTQQITNEF